MLNCSIMVDFQCASCFRFEAPTSFKYETKFQIARKNCMSRYLLCNLVVLVFLVCLVHRFFCKKVFFRVSRTKIVDSKYSLGRQRYIFRSGTRSIFSDFSSAHHLNLLGNPMIRCSNVNVEALSSTR